MYSRVITLSKMDVDKYICCRIGNHIVVDMTYLYTILVTWRQRGRTSLEMISYICMCSTRHVLSLKVKTQHIHIHMKSNA